MSYICFVGDLHLSAHSPVSRIDDYPTTILEKLKSLYATLSPYNPQAIIFLGDIFHKPRQPVDYLVDVVKAFKQSPFPMYSIVGNHDITYERLDTLDKSSLGLLFNSNIINHLDKLIIDRVAIYGADYNTEILPVNSPEYYNILACHRFYDMELHHKDSIMSKDLPYYNYDSIVLGHDHTNYINLTINHSRGETQIIRPGSFSRGTSHTYQLHKPIQVALFDTNAKQFQLIQIPYKPKEEVFSITVLNRMINKTSKYNEDLSKRFSHLLSKISNSNITDKGADIYRFVSELEDSDIKATIIQYLELSGIFNKN